MSPFYARLAARHLRYCDKKKVIENAKVEVICVPSYSAKRSDRLALATQTNLESALHFWTDASPLEKPLIVFGSCSHAFRDADIYEERMKIEMCARYGARCLSCGPITNSVTEMDLWRKRLSERDKIPKKMLVTTCELHSGAELLLSRIIFPEVKTYVWAESHTVEVESDHPTDDQASWPRWVWASERRYYAFKYATKLSPDRQKKFLDFLRTRQHKPGRVKIQPRPLAA